MYVINFAGCKNYRITRGCMFMSAVITVLWQRTERSVKTEAEGFKELN